MQIAKPSSFLADYDCCRRCGCRHGRCRHRRRRCGSTVQAHTINVSLKGAK